MALPAQLIIQNVQIALNDVEGVRHPASDLVRHLNKAQRDIQIVRPDTTATTENWELAPGFLQTLPDHVASLIDIPANATGKRRRITKVSRLLLEASVPEWRNAVQTTEVMHFMHETKQPRKVEVYPPANASSIVELEFSAYPQDIPPPTGTGAEYTTVVGTISLGDKWQGVLESLILYYAYATDLEGARNQELAAQYLQMANTMLGAELQVSAATHPKD